MNGSFCGFARRKIVQLRSDGSTRTANDTSAALRMAVSSVWVPKSLDNTVDLDLTFKVEREKIVLKSRASVAIDGDEGAASMSVLSLGISIC